jgi:hypothetical protein
VSVPLPNRLLGQTWFWRQLVTLQEDSHSQPQTYFHHILVLPYEREEQIALLTMIPYPCYLYTCFFLPMRYILYGVWQHVGLVMATAKNLQWHFPYVHYPRFAPS